MQTYCAQRGILKADWVWGGDRLRFLFTFTLLSGGATLCSPYGIKVYRALSPGWIAALQSHMGEWGSLLRLYQNHQLAPKTFALDRRAALLYSTLGESKRAEEMIQQAVNMRPSDLQARELKSLFGCPR